MKKVLHALVSPLASAAFLCSSRSAFNFPCPAPPSFLLSMGRAQPGRAGDCQQDTCCAGKMQMGPREGLPQALSSEEAQMQRSQESSRSGVGGAGRFRGRQHVQQPPLEDGRVQALQGTAARLTPSRANTYSQLSTDLSTRCVVVSSLEDVASRGRAQG